MDYLTSMEMSKVWGISSRRVSLLCSEGRVAGAEKKGVGHFSCHEKEEGKWQDDQDICTMTNK